MGRAAAGTPKAIANQQKSKGLQRLRWYCQVCEKQCRDENGFKCHTQSEGHLRQMLVVGENAGKHIATYSSQFQSEFVAMWSRRWGTKRVLINLVYQEYISNKTHLHMNATRFGSLTAFAAHLGRSGQAHVEESEKGFYISWIDNSPRALSKAQEGKKKEKSDEGDEMRERRLIETQIGRARREGERRAVEARGGVWDGETDESLALEEQKRELVREEGEKVSLSLSFKAPIKLDPSPPPASISPPIETPTIKPEPSDDSLPPVSSSTISPPSTSVPSLSFKSTTPAPAFKPSTNAFKSNPLKSNPLKPNPLKSNPLAIKAKSATPAPSMGPQKRALSQVELIMKEDLIKKARLGGGRPDSRGGQTFRG